MNSVNPDAVVCVHADANAVAIADAYAAAQVRAVVAAFANAPTTPAFPSPLRHRPRLRRRSPVDRRAHDVLEARWLDRGEGPLRRTP